MNASGDSAAPVRRAVAYIAWRLITGQEGTTIRDHGDDTKVTYHGSVTETAIDVRDDNGCHLVGRGGSGMYTLEPGGDRRPVTLKISGLDFEGFDYSAACRYSGTVDRRQLSVSHGRESVTYAYSID